jgi:hypothetical protein
MLRKIQLFHLTVLAVSAISVMFASVASAEVGLWAADGKEVTTELDATATGSLDLTDLGAPGGAVTVDCEGALDGYVEAGGLDHISEVLYLGKKETENLIECEVVKGHEGLCETGMLADVIPTGLPWESRLELSGAKFVDHTASVGGGSLGYMVTCLTILGETLDECTQASAEQEMKEVSGGVEGVSKEEDTGNCSLGGNREGDIEGSGLTTLTNGEKLGLESP